MNSISSQVIFELKRMLKEAIREAIREEITEEKAKKEPDVCWKCGAPREIK